MLSHEIANLPQAKDIHDYQAGEAQPRQDWQPATAAMLRGGEPRNTQGPKDRQYAPGRVEIAVPQPCPWSKRMAK